MTAPGPTEVLGPGRCKRFAIHVVDSVIKAVNVSEAPDDPVRKMKPFVIIYTFSPRRGNINNLFAPHFMCRIITRLEIRIPLHRWQMEYWPR